MVLAQRRGRCGGEQKKVTIFRREERRDLTAANKRALPQPSTESGLYLDEGSAGE